MQYILGYALATGNRSALFVTSHVFYAKSQIFLVFFAGLYTFLRQRSCTSGSVECSDLDVFMSAIVGIADCELIAIILSFLMFI